MAQCLDVGQVGWGSYASPLYFQDFCVATIWGQPISVKAEDEFDEQGNVIGAASGIVTDRGVAIIHKRLFRAFAIEFQAFQNGPIRIEAYDSAGMYQGKVDVPFDPPQGVRRFASIYNPRGIGHLMLFGEPSAIVEGHILRVCPLCEDLGPNPAFPQHLDDLKRRLEATTASRPPAKK